MDFVNTSSDSKRKQVSFEQLVALLDFLKDHSELAKGLARGRRGKLHTVKLWHLCAKKINTFKSGANKDGKGWAKYWCDWKYRVRRKALELRAAKESNRPPPEGITQMSPLEETILSIIGDHAVDKVIIKTDPLAEEVSGEDESEDNDNNEDIPANKYLVSKSALKPNKERKRQHSPKMSSDLEDRSGPTTPTESKLKLTRLKNEDDDSEIEEDTKEFLRIEKEKLENNKKILECVQTIASEMTRLVDVMGHIRDVLTNNKNGT